ncbi:MAG: enoyl-CoA hydratase-related protein, partial [Dehalococcoidia bacterium]
GFVTEDWERAAYQVPDYIRDLVGRGWTGDKGGQGFYKRVREGGATQILTLDPATMEYRPRRRAQDPSLAAAAGQGDVGTRLRELVNADDRAGRFAWRVLSQVLAYSARKVGEVADDIDNIDRAMRWGFGWELGPFEAWDALGVADSVRRMVADGVQVPGWVMDLVATGNTFYRREHGRSLQINRQSTYTLVAKPEETISLAQFRDEGRRITEGRGGTLYDLGDGVAYFDFHPPKQAIDRDFMELLDETMRRVPRDFRGLVIGSHVLPNFCVGANVALMLEPAMAGNWDQIDKVVKAFQRGLLSLKRLPIPVVVAPYGATVGGGAEIALAADRVTAAAETYLGLVEVGAGIVPAGGGCKELLLRALQRHADPAGAVAAVFETIGLARTSGSAHEARSLGFLRAEDTIVPNPDHLLYEAKQAALALDARGYVAPSPARLPVVGEGLRAALEETVQGMVAAGQATEHDLTIARKLAYVLTGGDRPAGSDADEEHFLELEREALVSLCREPKSQERLQHILETGRPLRN